jgi:hypothetical protein
LKTTQELSAALESCLLDAGEDHLTVRGAMDRLQEGSYAFLCLLFTIPFLQPISLGPLSAVGGMIFATLGWQWARGRRTPWIPDRVGNLKPGKKAWMGLLEGCRKILRFGSRFAKPRMSGLVLGARGDAIAGTLMILGGLLISIPFPGIPLNNTFPALIVVLACLGWLEKDGLLTVCAFGMIFVSLSYFALIFGVIYFFGTQALNFLPAIFR